MFYENLDVKNTTIKAVNDIDNLLTQFNDSLFKLLRKNYKNVYVKYILSFESETLYIEVLNGYEKHFYTFRNSKLMKVDTVFLSIKNNNKHESNIQKKEIKTFYTPTLNEDTTLYIFFKFKFKKNVLKISTSKILT